MELDLRQALQSDRAYIRASYRRTFGEEPDLERPRNLNEKMQWRKLYDRNPPYTRCSDKLQARDHVAQRIGADYLVPLLAVADKPEELDIDSLPDAFVVKANHGSQWNIFVPIKAQLDRRSAGKTMKQWLGSNFYRCQREWQYRDIPPRILVEPLLLDGEGNRPDEYRFFCFQGRAQLLEVVRGRFEKATTVDYFKPPWRHLAIAHKGHDRAGDLAPRNSWRTCSGLRRRWRRISPSCG